MNVREIALCDLRERSGGRMINKNSIPILMESIREVGILNPLRVRPIMVLSGPYREVPGWEITSGRHRFLAAMNLRDDGDHRFDTVPCDIVENEDDIHRDLAEIDENLCRTDLSQSERARQTARRKEIFEELHPETVSVRIRGGPGRGHKNESECRIGFIDATSKATGKGRTTISLDAERGEKINGKALDAVSGTPLDKGVYLDRLKEVPLEKQLSVVEQDLASKVPHKGHGRPRNEDGQTTRGEAAADWIFANINTTKIPTFISLLEGTQPKYIIAALRRMLAE